MTTRLYRREMFALAKIALVAVVFCLSGCGGGYSSAPMTPTNPASPQTAAVTLTVTDAPPAGVTVLAFEVTVTGAVLSPGNVPLVSNPQRIEVKQLETDSAFLSTTDVPAGTYQSIAISLANPELTIQNQSGAAIGNCANHSICEIEPKAAGNITLSGAPFPVTLEANTPAGFQVDVHVGNLISSTLSVDFSAAAAVSLAQLPLNGQPNDHLDELDDLQGTVQNLDSASSKFTLQTMAGDFLVATDSNTQFEIEGCAADNFSCLQDGQGVEVDAKLMAGGAFVAEKIDVEDENEANENEVEGVVVSVDDATHFEMVVLGELQFTPNVDLGNAVTIKLNNPQFQVQNDGFSVPSVLQGAFESASDTSQLLPGQQVQVRSKNGPHSGSPITMATDRIRLRMSQLTGNVAGPPTLPNFNVANLPGLFTSAGINSIQVQTSNNTDFQNVASVGALLDQDQVSLRGLLFKSGTTPSLIADKVRKR